MAVLLPAGVILFTVLVIKFFTDYIIKAGAKIGVFARAVSAVRGCVVKFRRLFERHTNIMGHELYRIFISHAAGIVLIMPCFFAPDLQTGVYKITDVTRFGKKKLRILRYIMGIVTAVLIAVAAAGILKSRAGICRPGNIIYQDVQNNGVHYCMKCLR